MLCGAAFFRAVLATTLWLAKRLQTTWEMLRCFQLYFANPAARCPRSFAGGQHIIACPAAAATAELTCKTCMRLFYTFIVDLPK
jgi:hypothetical protein